MPGKMNAFPNSRGFYTSFSPSHEWYLSFLDFRIFRFCRWHVYKRNFSRGREKGRKESTVIYSILVGNCFQDLQQTVQSLDDVVSHKNDGAVTNSALFLPVYAKYFWLLTPDTM